MKHTKETIAELKRVRTENRNPDNKPVVLYYNPPQFFTSICDFQKAEVHAVDHPRLGIGKVYTSRILKIYEDDTFETLNTMYVRFPDNDLAENS